MTDATETVYQRWRREHGVSHGHCPHECEHPQPQDLDGVLVCGHCLVRCGVVSMMVPCTPETCGE